MKIKVALLVLIFSVTAVLAYIPIIDDSRGSSPSNPIVITDMELSQIIYREIGPVRPLWISFSAREGQTLYLRIGVPKIDRYANFRPNVGVFGPGFFGNSFPFDPPYDTGLKINTDNQNPGVFDEPLSGTQSWILSETSVNITRTGKYQIYAHSSGDGKMWISIGQKESSEGLAKMYDDIYKVRYFHELSGPAPLVILISVIALIILAIIVFLVRRYLKKRTIARKREAARLQRAEMGKQHKGRKESGYSYKSK